MSTRPELVKLSPKKQPPTKLTDAEIGYKYIEFPEDTFFMESLSQNSNFDNLAYVPVQRYVHKKEESHVYTVTPDSETATHIAGPIAAPDGDTDCTIFGSALSDKGILYLCCFNRNSILALDLTEDITPGEPVRCKEYPNVPSPNDVCIDPNDENSLYVCAGTFRDLMCVEFSNAAYGQLYQIKLGTSDPPNLICTNCKTLAGVEIVDGKLWVAQLFDMFTIAQGSFNAIPQVQWEGTDDEDMVWLADNIDVFDGNTILCPAYTRAPLSTVQRFMHRAWLSSTILFFVQLTSACLTCEPLGEAFRDPEVALAFSNTYIKDNVDPEPVRLVFIKDGEAKHFEVDLVQTRKEHGPRDIMARDGGERFIGNATKGDLKGAVQGGSKNQAVLGKRHFFNEQVTHAAHMGDWIACVNFEQPRILLLSDKLFREKMNE